MNYMGSFIPKKTKMIINNKIDKLFGPSGVFSGYILMAVGVISSFFYLEALALILIGAYTAFSSSGTIIDTEEMKVKHYFSHFGLLNSGKWIALDNFAAIKISKSNLSYSTFSQSNRQSDIKKIGYRISLAGQSKKKDIPVKHCKTIEDAKHEAEKYSKELDFPVQIVTRRPGRQPSK